MIEIEFPGGEKIKVETRTPVSELAGHFGALDGTLAAVFANNKALSLNAPLEVNTVLSPIMLESPIGASIYRHTLSFLLCAASKKVFPRRHLRVGQSIGDCYYYYYQGGKNPGGEEIKLLKNAIDELIKSALPIYYSALFLDDAINYFTKENQLETALLLRQKGNSNILVNICAGYIDLYTGPLLSNTSLIKDYDLFPYQDGFLMHFPALVKDGGKSTLRMNDFEDSHKLFSVFYEHKKRGRIATVQSTSELNDRIIQSKIQEFIYEAEAESDKRMARIADSIEHHKEDIKLILIAGPSSSGKTTSAKKLSIQLKVLGIEPIAVSLDDYYLPPDMVPKDEDGAPDFECLEALDVEYLNKQLVELFEGREVKVPLYDFKTGKRGERKPIKLKNRRCVLVLEGIHGLNDALTPLVPNKNKFKLYVSALTQINLDDHNRTPTTDNRLLRRIVRDYLFRGMSAERSLKMWPAVQEGAKKHIFKFQDSADAIFNSALDYEIGVLRLYADPLLRPVSHDSTEYAEASRLLSFLENFYLIPGELVPELSILREFIGGSGFKY